MPFPVELVNYQKNFKSACEALDLKQYTTAYTEEEDGSVNYRVFVRTIGPNIAAQILAQVYALVASKREFPPVLKEHVTTCILDTYLRGHTLDEFDGKPSANVQMVLDWVAAVGPIPPAELRAALKETLLSENDIESEYVQVSSEYARGAFRPMNDYSIWYVPLSEDAVTELASQAIPEV